MNNHQTLIFLNTDIMKEREIKITSKYHTPPVAKIVTNKKDIYQIITFKNEDNKGVKKE